MENRRSLLLTAVVVASLVVLFWFVRGAGQTRLVIYNDADEPLRTCRIAVDGRLLDGRPMGAEESREYTLAEVGAVELVVVAPRLVWREMIEVGPGTITIVHLRRGGEVEAYVQKSLVRLLWDFGG